MDNKTKKEAKRVKRILREKKKEDDEEAALEKHKSARVARRRLLGETRADRRDCAKRRRLHFADRQGASL